MSLVEHSTHNLLIKVITALQTLRINGPVMNHLMYPRYVSPKEQYRYDAPTI